MEGNIRKENKVTGESRLEAFGRNMRAALSLVSKTKEGRFLLIFIMQESGFLSSLKMNGDEAKRESYLVLRSYMDRETIMRIELPDDPNDKQGGTNAGTDNASS